MAGKRRLRMEVSGIMDAPTAFYLLTNLENNENRKWLEGYRPFSVLDYNTGELVLECLPKDAGVVRSFVKKYLSDKSEEIRKGLR
ncbi:MAG: hypothetical protein NTY20_03740 [Candidatus Aenigmarchaeota archaeon]|nr:hypothetical protein [Candidatus Aenigmarchaeota archaeon]